MSWRKSAVLRKGYAVASRVPRALRRWRASSHTYRASPPVLGNSFPKSGTHLLLQILEALPLHNYGTFIASTPSRPFRERSPASIKRKIEALAPGELALGHLFHGPDVSRWLAERQVVHYFILRDLRDVAVSEAFYLTYMNRWHGMHRYFSRVLRTDDERILCAITGVAREECGYDYPDIGRRFQRYAPWLTDPTVHAIRYEDLHYRSELTIEGIVHFYEERTRSTIDRGLFHTRLRHTLAPQKSHTFRRGEPGNWRTVFRPIHTDACKRVANPYLLQLGYESTEDW